MEGIGGQMEKTYKFTEQQINNLVVFLNRVDYKGLAEVQAVTEIMAVLASTEPTTK